MGITIDERWNLRSLIIEAMRTEGDARVAYIQCVSGVSSLAAADVANGKALRAWCDLQDALDDILDPDRVG